MKQLTVICLFFLFANPISSQTNSHETKIANLKSKIAKTEHAEKLKWLDSLSTLLISENLAEQDSTLARTFELAVKLDSVNIAGRRLSDIMDHLNNVEGKPEEALTLYKKHQTLVPSVTDYGVLARIYLNLGDSYYYLKDYDRSIRYYDSTQTEAIRANDNRIQALALMYKGTTMSSEGKFAEASKELQKSARIFSQMGDTSNIINAKNSLSILYSKNSFFKEADAEREEAIALARKIKNYGQLVIFYFNAAIDAKKMGNQKLRIEKLQESLEIARNYEYTELYVPTILAELATAYAQQGKIEEAEKYLSQLATLPQNTVGKTQEAYLEALKYIAFARGDFREALKYGRLDLDKKLKTTDFEDIMGAEKFLAEVYESLGNHEQALRQYKNYNAIKDSISNIENVTALSYYQTIYETEKRDLIINAQKTNIALLDAENREKNQWLLFGGLGLFGVFGFVLLIRSRNTAKRRQRMQEHFSQELIKAQEEERLRVARELHDSVGQKLMLLTKKTKSSGNLEMETLAGNTLEELRSISRGLHPSNLEKLGLTTAIKTLINEVDANTNIFFTQEIEDIDGLISKESSLHLYRIIQEILNNMLKHADAKSASVVIEKNVAGIEATISDNGRGFEFSDTTKDSLGMKTLMERAKILNSKIDIQSQRNRGTTVRLSIPV